MTLCEHHVETIRNLEHLDHVGDRDSERVAISIARQCPQCLTTEGSQP